jgi:hypothetical protein
MVDGTASLDLGKAKLTQPMAIGNGQDALGGTYLSTSVTDYNWDGQGKYPADSGQAQFPITVSKGGSYTVWLKMFYENVDANSFWVVVDNGPGIKMGNEDAGYNTWKWVNWRDGDPNNKVTVNLSPGAHTITIIGREAGAKLSGIVLSDDASYVPKN